MHSASGQLDGLNSEAQSVFSDFGWSHSRCATLSLALKKVCPIFDFGGHILIDAGEGRLGIAAHYATHESEATFEATFKDYRASDQPTIIVSFA